MVSQRWLIPAKSATCAQSRQSLASLLHRWARLRRALLFHAPWGSPLQPSPVACSDSTQPLSPCWPSHVRPDPHSSLFSSSWTKATFSRAEVRCKMTLILIRNSWRHSGFTCKPETRLHSQDVGRDGGFGDPTVSCSHGEPPCSQQEERSFLPPSTYV